MIILFYYSWHLWSAVLKQHYKLTPYELRRTFTQAKQASIEGELAAVRVGVMQ